VKILKFPLAKLFLGFLSGILYFSLDVVDTAVIFTGIALCICGLLICNYYSKKRNMFQIPFGFLVLLASFFIGMATSVIHKESLNPHHYSNQISNYDDSHQLDLLLTDKLKSTSKNNRFICEVKSVDNLESYGKILLNIPKTKKIKTSIGSHLWINGLVLKNKNPSNPNLFDYGNYLENQEIYAQVFANQVQFGRQEKGLLVYFADFRETIISNLEQSNISKQELTVLNALILGQQQDISAEVLKDYQYAGAVHVLSVSGLHVGFIILFMGFLMKPVGNSRKGLLVKMSITLMALWSFAILTGLSPSIIRAVTMFSFVAVGIHLRRTVNIYHTLLVSMLLILLFKPSFLFDVGFQLSYLALFFILWLQPTLSRIWQPENKIIKYFWDIITVSFAAQIGTMPLSIYYFHQFPGLFFVTNLLILPLLGIIMAVGVLAILIAIFNPVPWCIAGITEWLIKLLNAIIHCVASAEMFVMKSIPFSKEMLMASYLFIIMLFLWIKKPDFKRLAFTFIGIIILQGIFLFQKEKTFHQEEFIVFSCRKNTIITGRTGNAVNLYSTDSILQNAENNLLVQSYLVGNFCHIKNKRPLQNLMYLKSLKILIIDSSCVYPKEIKPDLLIIVQSPKLNMERLLKEYRPKQVVADGSNFMSYIRLWEATCRKEKIPFHNTNEKGFYKI